MYKDMLATPIGQLVQSRVLSTASQTGLCLDSGEAFPYPRSVIIQKRGLLSCNSSHARRSDHRKARYVGGVLRLSYIGGLDYLNGRILAKSGIELFVGVKEFPESIRALEERE